MKQTTVLTMIGVFGLTIWTLAIIGAVEKLHGEGADRIMAAALRAIAGGRDE